MEAELQEMRELVAQLKADNERLRQERAPVELLDPGAASSSVSRPVTPSSVDLNVGTVERFVFIPRERRCPKFNGRSGVGIEEWVEEAQACMRMRTMTVAEQAFFLFDHLEGEARDEIKYRPSIDKDDPERIISALRELYGCAESYIALLEVFYSRRQLEGETLQEFSLVLLGLFDRLKRQAPHTIPNADSVVRDQFIEGVLDNALRRELKQLVRRQPAATLLDVRGEAIRWEREGMPGGARGRSQSVPLVRGIQCGVQGDTGVRSEHGDRPSELVELREMFNQQQKQLDQLTQIITRSQSTQLRGHSPRPTSVICRRCQQPGHFARECNWRHHSPGPPTRSQADSSSDARPVRSSFPNQSGN